MTTTQDGCASSTRSYRPEPPFLFADASHWQGESPDWKLIAEHCTGIILKATQGLHYAPSWFVRHWQAVRDVGGDRYGSTWLRGAYHYLDFFASGAHQADVFLDHVDKAGGWGHGDIMPIVDVERGGGNRDADGQMVIARVEAFVGRVKARTGRNVILYGRGAMRDLAIRSMMGCVGVWNPSYTRTMRTEGLPCEVDDVLLWQYTDGSAGDASVHGCPLRLPGWKGGLDLSVAVDGARKPELERVCERLLGR
ncbi:MAG TPA: glycoside hydrolase family 25 protein [Acidimicrobiales bacterium]